MQPWDQLPEESDRAYHAFLLYRDQGRKRQMQKVAEQYSNIKKSQGKSHLYNWRNKYNWDDRVRAWDLHLDRIHQAEWEEQRREESHRDLKAAQEAQASTMLMIRACMPSRQARAEGELPDPRQAANLERAVRSLREAINMKRITLGVPETYSESKEKVEDLRTPLEQILTQDFDPDSLYVLSEEENEDTAKAVADGEG